MAKSQWPVIMDKFSSSVMWSLVLIGHLCLTCIYESAYTQN